MDKSLKELTTQQKEFCQYSGLVGIGIGLVCFFQQLYIFSETFWVAFLFATSAIAGIIGFILLSLCKKETGVWLLIAVSLLFIRQIIIAWLLVKYNVMMVSLIQTVFFIYSLVIGILFFANGLPEKLKLIAANKKEEEEYWNTTLQK
jgi:hypothetical protein